MTWLALWRFLTGSLWRTAALGLALALAWQSYRADHWHTLYGAERAAHSATKANFREAAAKAEAAAFKAKADAEERYRQHAERTDREATEAIADARAAAQRYIERMRVKTPASAAGGPVAPAESGDARLPENLPPDPVVVGAADLQALAEWVAYGLKAREWAMGLEAATR